MLFGSMFRSMTRVAPLAGALAAITVLAPSIQAAKQPMPKGLQAHKDFNLADFAGAYFEVARMAHFPSLMCADATANFAPIEGDKDALNAAFSCKEYGFATTLSGTLRPYDVEEPGHMDFEYDEIFTRHSDFSVLIAAKDYSWFLVGERGRKNAFVYSANPSIDPAVLRDLVIRLNTDFDYKNAERLMRCTQHDGAQLPGCAEVLPD